MRAFFKEHRWQITSLVLIGSLLYIFNLNGPLFYDDLDWIVNNPPIHGLTWENITYIFTHDSLAGVHLISYYYRPVTFLVFQLIYSVSGTDPFLYHLTNNLLHLACGVLVYSLIYRWLGKKRVAFIASFLFVIHPIQTESVAYVSALGEPLAAFFVLLGLLLFLHKKRVWAGVAMLVGLLARETAIAFPLYLGAVLVAFELTGTFWERFKTAFVRILPYVGIGVAYSLFRTFVLHILTTTLLTGQDTYATHVSYRIYTFLHALAVYLHLIIVPVGLHMNRTIPVSEHLSENFSWVGALLVLASLAILVWLYRKNALEDFGVWFAGLGFWYVYLSMTSGILRPLNAVIYEHWLYISLIGFFMIAAWYVDKAWEAIEAAHGRGVWLFISLLTLYAVFLSYQTIQRNLLWANPIGLYKDILVYEPNNTQALENLGEWYFLQRDNVTAQILFGRAIAINPSDPLPYVALGVSAALDGKNDEAEQLFKKAIESAPTFDPAYYNLASLYTTQNRTDEALSLLETLERLHPTQSTEDFITYLKNPNTAPIPDDPQN